MAQSPMSMDNPAARLHAVLERAWNQQNGSAQEAWAKVFNIKNASGRAMMRRGLELQDQAAEVRRRISQLQDHGPDDYLKFFPQVEAVLGNFSNMQLTMVQFMAPLNDAGMYGLQLCSSMLSRYDREPIVEENTLEYLLERVEDLYIAVKDATDLDNKMRSWLLDRLLNISNALRRYDVLGSEAVAKASDAFVGGLLRGGTLERIRNSSVIKGVVMVAACLDVSFNLAANYEALTAGQGSPERPIMSVAVVHIQQQCGITITPQELGLPQKEIPAIEPPQDGL